LICLGSGDSEFSGLDASPADSRDEQIEPRELDRLPTKQMFFKGIFLVCVLGGELDPSVSEGDDLRVDKKLRFYSNDVNKPG